MIKTDFEVRALGYFWGALGRVLSEEVQLFLFKAKAKAKAKANIRRKTQKIKHNP